ncbi:MAG: undecaprenyl-diphosphate phosphatase [Planctomycetaceae bacterium]
MGGLLDAIVLGVVQGLTEFLPVSSSGHLALLQMLLGWENAEENLTFTIVVHLGSLAAVMIYVGREIRAMLTTQPRLLGLVVVATLPVVVVGLLARSAVASLGAYPAVVGGGLLVTALLLASTTRIREGDSTSRTLSYRKALLVGVAQLFALLPGVSRSGTTLTAALRAGMQRNEALRFAFLMAVPAIGGAGFLLLLKGGAPSGMRLTPLLAGGAASFASSFLAMHWIARLVEKRRLIWFSVYCAAAGLLALLFAVTR